MRRILVVDDDLVSLMAVKTVLSEKYEVVTQPTGIEALEYLKNNTCDLILLDVEMPMLNGIETLKEIRAMDNGKMVPVLFLTADSRRDTVMEAAKLGIIGYITKPFDYQILRMKIEMTIENAKAAAADEELYTRLIEVLMDLKNGRTKQATTKLEAALDMLNRKRLGNL